MFLDKTQNKKFVCLFITEAATRGVLQKKTVLKNFAMLIGKHLCLNLFLIKSQDWRPATLLKRGSNTCVFLWILWNLLRAPILKYICERLLLAIVIKIPFKCNQMIFCGICYWTMGMWWDLPRCFKFTHIKYLRKPVCEGL